MPNDLEQALAVCEALLEQERRDGADDALIAAKEAATAGLQAALGRTPALVDQALVARLQAVMAANRYSLRWSSLRVKLAQIGQPRQASQVQGPRIDLVH